MPRKRKIKSKIIFPKPLEQKHVDVIYALVDIGPTNIYQIAKRFAERRVKGKISPRKLAKRTRELYSLVYYSIKDLESRRIALPRGKKKTEKGTSATVYDLSLEGVLLLLQREMRYAETNKWNRKLIQEVVDKYSYLLPLVFGKWHHFKKMQVEKIASFRLKVLVDTFVADPSGFKKGTTFIFGKRGCEMEENVCWFFYFQLQHFKYGLAWMNALRQDEEIKNYVIGELQLFRKNIAKLDGIINSTLQQL